VRQPRSVPDTHLTLHRQFIKTQQRWSGIVTEIATCTVKGWAVAAFRSGCTTPAPICNAAFSGSKVPSSSRLLGPTATRDGCAQYIQPSESGNFGSRCSAALTRRNSYNQLRRGIAQACWCNWPKRPPHRPPDRPKLASSAVMYQTRPRPDPQPCARPSHGPTSFQTAIGVAQRHARSSNRPQPAHCIGLEHPHPVLANQLSWSARRSAGASPCSPLKTRPRPQRSRPQFATQQPNIEMSWACSSPAKSP